MVLESKGEREVRRILETLKQDTKGDLKLMKIVCLHLCVFSYYFGCYLIDVKPTPPLSQLCHSLYQTSNYSKCVQVVVMIQAFDRLYLLAGK